MEWFKRRHPDGGMRQKAVEEKLRVANAATAAAGQWNPIGPQPIQSFGSTYSGRVWGIAVDPRNSNVVYVGTDGGGVWKTTNGGTNWVPLTDSQANINIRDIALAPSAPDTVFAVPSGSGIQKSTDGGVTWTTLNIGYSFTSIAVHPSNPSIVLAASYGLISRSDDGGNTWSIRLNLGGYGGQVVFDPTNGSIVYAAMGDGLRRSTDGGVIWALVGGAGLPSGTFQYVTVAIAPSNPSLLYLTLKNAHTIGFYRSTNSGATWTQLGVPPNDDVPYWGWSLRVHPTNPNLLYAGSLRLSMSTDGGATWVSNDSGLHVDHHVQVYSADGNTLFIGNDGGIWKTSIPMATNTAWTNLNSTLNTVMFYPGISISPSTLNTTFGGTQDNGVLRYQGTLPWNKVGLCGDGGYTAIDFNQPQNVYASCQSGVTTEITASTDGGTSFHAAQSGINLQDGSDFIPPLIMDPSNPRRLYFGTYRLYQTVDGASSWNAISPSLTNSSGAINTIAVAPSDPNTVYTGASNGAVFITRNALSGTASTWTARNLPFSQDVTQIAVDPQNPLIAWAAVGYTAYGLAGHVYKTTDGGGTWTNLSSGLPNLTVSDLLLDPDIANTLYAGTDIGVYRSVDGGQSWLPLGSGMPNVIVHAIRLDRPSRTLRAATYGRGMWDLSVPVSGQVAITVSSNTAGAYFSLEDGSTHQAPTSFFWYTGSQHTVTWLSAPPVGAGARYLFSGWSDGASQNARTITVPATGTTYTGNISAQYLLTVTASPALGGSISLNPSSTDGYYNAGQSVQISATAAGGYGFGYLSGDLNGSLPQSITMSAPHSVTVNFYCQFSYNYPPYSVGSAGTAGFLTLQTGAGCSWTFTSPQSWLTLSPASGTGPATVAYSIAANTGSSRSVTVTGTGSFAVNQDAAGTGRPSIVSMTPNSGSGGAQVFTYVFSDPSGSANIQSTILRLQSAPFTNPACNVYFSRFSGFTYLYLLSDDGNSWGTGVSLPSANTLQNSQCSIDASRTSASGSGNTLTVMVAATFKAVFAGTKLATAYAYDSVSGLSSSEQMMGTWTVLAGTPTPVSVTPSSGNASSGNFQTVATDTAGFADIARIELMFVVPGSTHNYCDLIYERAQNRLSLVNDAGTAWLGPVNQGTGGTLSNSQCTINSSTATVVGNANTLTVTFPVTFASGFQGTKNIYLSGTSAGNQTTGYQLMGTWTVPGPTAVLSIAKSHGGTFVQGQPGTYSVDVKNAQSAGATTGTVTVTETIPSGLTLTSMSGTGWTCPNGATTCSRSDALAAGASYAPITVNVNIAANAPSQVTNQVSVAGGGSVSASALDITNILPDVAPAPVSVTPSSGSASSANFQTVVTDTSGFADIARIELMFVVPGSTHNYCDLIYQRAENRFSIVNDAATAWLGPVNQGTGGTLSNSQCSLNASAATVLANGTTLTVTFPVTFSAGFTGTKNIYLYGASVGNQTTGYQLLGTWSAQSATPTPVSVTPSSGSTSSANFQTVVTDTAGYADIVRVELLFVVPGSTHNYCDLIYQRAENRFSIVNDAATAWLGPVNQGTGGTLGNSQCSVNASAATVVGNGNTLTVTFPVTFAAGFPGTKNIYLYGVSTGNQSTGYQLMGTWAAPSATPTPVSVTPSSGSASSANFQTVLTDAAGFADISRIELLFVVPGSTHNYCDLIYQRAENRFSIVNDAATAWLGPVNQGTGGTLGNSQCSVNASAATVVGNANTLTVTFPVTFAAGFAGTKNIYLYGVSTANQSTGYQLMGTWSSAGATPTPVSVTPSSGSASSANFQTVVTDTLGFADISRVELLFVVPGSTHNYCDLIYQRAENRFWIVNDAATAWSGPANQGTGGTLGNAQCTLNASAATVLGNGNTLTVTFPVTFAAGFPGTKNIYLYGVSAGNQSTGYQLMGTWSAAGATPAPVSVNPPAGGASSSNFQTVFTDAAGFADIARVELLFVVPGSTHNYCDLIYQRAENRLWIVNDAGTGWVGPVTPGANVTLSNSQCTVFASAATVVSNGNNLAVTFPVAFSSAFAGPKNLYLYAVSAGNQSTGYQLMGNWIVP